MYILELHKSFRRYLLVEEGLSPVTIRGIDNAVKTFVKRTGCERLDGMTLATLQSFFYEGCEMHQWSYNSFANYHKYLKRFLNWCITQKYLKKNPILEIKRPKKPRSLPRRLAEEEGKKILYAAFVLNWRYEFERIRNHAMMATLLYTGIRAKELLNLEVMDLNLASGNLLIRSGKGNKDRNVPIHYKLLSALKRYIEERKRIRKESIVLFPSIKSSKPLNYKNLSAICRRISIEAGTKFTPHQLRHTFGSVAVEKGMDVTKLKEIMGHSEITSTMVYLKMSSKNLQESLNRLDMF